MPQEILQVMLHSQVVLFQLPALHCLTAQLLRHPLYLLSAVHKNMHCEVSQWHCKEPSLLVCGSVLFAFPDILKEHSAFICRVRQFTLLGVYDLQDLTNIQITQPASHCHMPEDLDLSNQTCLSIISQSLTHTHTASQTSLCPSNMQDKEACQVSAGTE